MKKAVIYIRVSSDEQIKGMSLNFQREDCFAYARTRNLEVAEVFEERGESAKFADRPQLIELLEHCRRKKNQIAALIVWKLDRLSRNQMDYYYIKRNLLDFGIRIHSATEQTMEDTTTIAGRIYETFSALQAEIDNTVRSERTRRGMEAKIAAGITPWKPPLGYVCQRAKRRGEKKHLPDEPDLKLFPLLRAALLDYAQGVVTLKGLPTSLNERGFAQITGKEAEKRLVYRLLHKYLDFYGGYVLNPWTGEKAKGLHRPLLSEREYRAVLVVRDGRRRKPVGSRERFSPEFPLRGTLRCAECGALLTGSISRGNGGSFAYYHCWTKSCPSYGKGCRREKVHAAFAVVADQHALTPAFVEALGLHLLAGWKEENYRSAAVREACEKTIAALDRKRALLFEMREDGSYTREEFLERKEAVEAELAAETTKLENLPGSRRDLEGLWGHAAEFLLKLSGSWSKMSPRLKRRFQEFAFPAGIPFHRKQGIGTVETCCILKLKSELGGCQSPWVAPRVIGWNHVEQSILDLGRKLQEEAEDLDSEEEPGLSEAA